MGGERGSYNYNILYEKYLFSIKKNDSMGLGDVAQ